MPINHSDDLAWCEIDGTRIFLDIPNDRYFRLDDDHNRATCDRVRKTNLLPWNQPPGFPRPSGWIAAVRAADAIESGPFRLGDVARALWTQRRAEHRLAQSGFAALLAGARSARERRCGERDPSLDGERRTIRAFEHARLLRTAADRCLPRSVALMLCLAARNVHAYIVIGVRIAPFGAHCWVESDGAVLNDSIEETARYQPILVL